VTLVVHALVLINIDSNMHGDEIKITNTYLHLLTYSLHRAESFLRS